MSAAPCGGPGGTKTSASSDKSSIPRVGMLLAVALVVSVGNASSSSRRSREPAEANGLSSLVESVELFVADVTVHTASSRWH
jgi:hypothetical protein